MSLELGSKVGKAQVGFQVVEAKEELEVLLVLPPPTSSISRSGDNTTTTYHYTSPGLSGRSGRGGDRGRSGGNGLDSRGGEKGQSQSYPAKQAIQSEHVLGVGF